MLCYLTVGMLHLKKAVHLIVTGRVFRKEKNEHTILAMGFFRLLSFISHLPSSFANNTIVLPLFCCISIAHPSYTPTRATPPKFCQVLATSAWYEIFFLPAGRCDFLYWLFWLVSHARSCHNATEPSSPWASKKPLCTWTRTE